MFFAVEYAYAQEHYIDQWQQAVDDYYLDFYVRNPDYLANLPEDKQLEITGNPTGPRRTVAPTTKLEKELKEASPTASAKMENTP